MAVKFCVMFIDGQYLACFNLCIGISLMSGLCRKRKTTGFTRPNQSLPPTRYGAGYERIFNDTNRFLCKP